ncbi:inner membrane ABC transporter permease protein YjfF [Enterobacter hormaechei]|nr:inner membrane ABC transporter permease protein YjfF [Enterobacter hormaechei]
MTFIILTGGIDLSVGSILGTTRVAAMVVSLIPRNLRCSPFRRR